MGNWTQASLISMVFQRRSESDSLSTESLRRHFVVVDNTLGTGTVIDMKWAKSLMEDTTGIQNVSVRNTLGLGTMMRLIRFLPDKFTDQWLFNFFHLSSQSLEVLEALSCCADWQPSLFGFISELIEKIIGLADLNPSENESAFNTSPKILLEKRLSVALELYAALLGHRLREAGDQVGARKLGKVLSFETFNFHCLSLYRL
jgi:hypothetical protein